MYIYIRRICFSFSLNKILSCQKGVYVYCLSYRFQFKFNCCKCGDIRGLNLNVSKKKLNKCHE